MAINRDAFIGNYLEETNENIQLIDDGVLKLKKDPENEEVLNAVLRALHTVKGSSRMLKFISMEKIAHALENVFKGLKEQRYTINANLVKLVFLGSDLFRAGTGKISTKKNDEMEFDKFIDVCEMAYANEIYAEELAALQMEIRGGGLGTPPAGESVPTAEAARAAEGGPAAGAAPAEGGGSGGLLARGAAKTVTGSEAGSVQAGTAESAAAPKESGGGEKSSSEYQSIRVKLSNVENIIEILNSVIIKQFQFKQIQEELNDTGKAFQQDLLSQIRKAQDSFKEDGVTLYKDAQQHLKTMQDIHKSFVEQMVSLEQNSYKLQEHIMKLSMLPLNLILGGLPRMVEEAALVLDKEINFTMTGTDILMDKAILEKLNDPVLHLIRNSVDHGIEMPDVREAAGKSRDGNIRVSCTSEGGNIIIRISDDGGGIDHDRVKQQALAKGLTNEVELEELADNDVYNFIFMPGFSTKKNITDLSGRGVGLDIVKHNIDKVKGKITVRSTMGQGTEFILALPLSLATVSGFFVKSGGEKFLIPSNFVQKIVRLNKDEKIMYYNKEAFKLENQIIPLYSLAALLGEEPENRGSFLYVLVVESVGERIGMVVDNLLQHESLIYKPVPNNLRKLKLIQGIVFDETYSIINILFIPELISRFKRLKAIDLMQGVGGKEAVAKNVLVVDDSLNTREIEKSILELENFQVVTAEDGIDGLEKLKESRIDLIITDLEMPRMDGITMIENIRKESVYRNLPIVVVSSSSENDVQQKAVKAGADAYIIKSEFDRNSLIATTGKLLGKV